MTVAVDEAVVWHDVECGGYAEDLPLWRELAADCGGPVLEIGCGTGRVALDLARGGHSVTGVDNDPRLVAALRERAAGLDLRALVADARRLDLPREFALVAAPMQVMQLLREPADRAAMLGAADRCARPGGRVAVSIVEGVPAGGGEMAQPLPDVAEVEGWVYSSLPLEIVDEGETMLVTRLRQTVSPAGELTEFVDETRLAVLDAEAVEREARLAGLRTVGRRDVPDTEAHLGSAVVLLERAPDAGQGG
jgi:SAM-dependent methyltransferase